MLNTAVKSVDWLHVVAAVIRGADGRILLAQRPADKHQGGKWEFPGGKREAGESSMDALARELDEELGIHVQQAEPLIKVRYVYPERAVLLDVWEVSTFSGKPHGREGQPVAWFNAPELSALEFPAANTPIVSAAQLPAQCLVTPDPQDERGFLAGLERALQAGVRLVQLRAKSLSVDEYTALAQQAVSLAHRYEAKLLLNAASLLVPEADGLHLSSQALAQARTRDALLTQGKLLSASCHSLEELQQATALGVDFALLGAVQATTSHPNGAVLGWPAFQTYAESVNFPVYALGGMQTTDVSTARLHGGQGIAAIRSLWA